MGCQGGVLGRLFFKQGCGAFATYADDRSLR